MPLSILGSPARLVLAVLVVGLLPLEAQTQGDCPFETFGGIPYQLTLANARFTTTCPAGVDGNVTRHCCGAQAVFDGTGGVCSAHVAGDWLTPSFALCHSPATTAAADAVTAAAFAGLQAALASANSHLVTVTPQRLGTQGLEELGAALGAALETIRADATVFSSLPAGLITEALQATTHLLDTDPASVAGGRAAAASVVDASAGLAALLAARAAADGGATDTEFGSVPGVTVSVRPVLAAPFSGASWPAGSPAGVTDSVEIGQEVLDTATTPFGLAITRFETGALHIPSDDVVPASSVLFIGASDGIAAAEPYLVTLNISARHPQADVLLKLDLAAETGNDINQVTINSITASATTAGALTVSYSFEGEATTSRRRRATVQGSSEITPMCISRAVGSAAWSLAEKSDCVLQETDAELVTCNCSALGISVAVLLTAPLPTDRFNIELATVGFVGVAAGLVVLVGIMTLCWRGKSFVHKPMIVFGEQCLAVGLAEVLFCIVLTLDYSTCKMEAMFLHLAVICVFMWTFLSGLVFYSTYVSDLMFSWEPRLYQYNLIGWGVPLLLLAMIGPAQINNYQTDRACWIDKGTGLWYAEIVPPLVLCGAALALLVQTLQVATEDFRRPALVALAAMCLQLLQWMFAYFALGYLGASVVHQGLFAIMALLHALLCSVFFFGQANVKDSILVATGAVTHSYDDVGQANVPKRTERGFSKKHLRDAYVGHNPAPRAPEPTSYYSMFSSAYANMRQKISSTYANMKGKKTDTYIDVEMGNPDAHKPRRQSQGYLQIPLGKRGISMKVQGRQQRESRLTSGLRSSVDIDDVDGPAGLKSPTHQITVEVANHQSDPVHGMRRTSELLHLAPPVAGKASAVDADADGAAAEETPPDVEEVQGDPVRRRTYTKRRSTGGAKSVLAEQGRAKSVLYHSDDET